MQCRRSRHLGSLVVAAVLMAFGLAARVHGPIPSGASTRGYELCLEQSPAQAGKLSPDLGTHRFSADEVVVLSAEPQPGYQFAYWLGDVADPKAQRTTVQINSSKIIVAVFQLATRDYPEEALFGGGGGGGGGLVATRIDLSSPGGITGGGGRPRSEPMIVPKPVPAPVPEPTTLLLLGLGALALRRKRP